MNQSKQVGEPRRAWIGWGTVFSLLDPLYLIALYFGSAMLLVKLPPLLCQKLRCFRWLSWFGALYSVLMTWAAYYWLGPWHAAFVGLAMLLLGDWLPPDPFHFIFHPRVRLAVRRAIQHLEHKGMNRPSYDNMCVLAANQSYCDLSIELQGTIRPVAVEYLRVHHTPLTIEAIPEEELEGLGVRSLY